MSVQPAEEQLSGALPSPSASKNRISKAQKTPAKTQPKEKAPKVDLSRPALAWPTLGLLVGCFAGWGVVAWLYLGGWWAGWLAAIVLSPLAFAAFTPMHDASHRSIGNNKRLNELVGRMSGLFLLAPFPAFRWIHLEHHKHTNDPEKDPDFWTSRPFLLFRWLTLDLHYYVLYIRAGSRRPLGERIETWISFALIWGAAAVCLALAPWPTLVLWLIPARMGVLCLALFFDYLPHVPHHTTSAEDRYRATNVIRGPHALLSPLLLYQNYHLIHHLYPGVPFYRYARIWFTQRDFLKRQGAQEVTLWGTGFEESPQPHTSDTSTSDTSS